MNLYRKLNRYSGDIDGTKKGSYAVLMLRRFRNIGKLFGYMGKFPGEAEQKMDLTIRIISVMRIVSARNDTTSIRDISLSMCRISGVAAYPPDTNPCEIIYFRQRNP